MERIHSMTNKVYSTCTHQAQDPTDLFSHFVADQLHSFLALWQLPWDEMQSIVGVRIHKPIFSVELCALDCCCCLDCCLGNSGASHGVSVMTENLVSGCHLQSLEAMELSSTLHCLPLQLLLDEGPPQNRAEWVLAPWWCPLPARWGSAVVVVP